MKKNNKGFTLIELLAVIVIMGILMVIAIPMMTRYIENSRKDTFISTAKAYINGAKYQYLNDDFGSCSAGAAGVKGYIILDKIDLDSGGNKSSFGNTTIDTENSYVLIETDAEGKVTYSIAIRDKKSNGVTLTKEAELGRSSVSKGTVTSLPKPSGSASCAS